MSTPSVLQISQEVMPPLNPGSRADFKAIPLDWIQLTMLG